MKKFLSFSVRSFSLSFRGTMMLLLALAQVVWALPMQPVAAAPALEDAQPITVDPAPLRDGEPQLILTKTVDDNVTEAQVGDEIRYRIRWECSSLTTACGEMEITDVLQNGLTYLPPPASSVPSGFSISYTGGTRTVTITKDDDNLLDGTQYDAVIVVRVNQDFRPLPSVINNTVNGRIDPPGPVGWQNATPALAPPISIGAVSPSWNLIKTRVAPVIEPTLDTNVTYRLQLCPVIPPSGGIADLTNIVLTDTLPANAIFVSATGGGTESGGVVTWPAEPGPLSPPTCLTRFVTINYPSSHFSIGDDLTNSADVEADYIDSNGDPCPDCFGDTATEPDAELIYPEVVPTYSKNDAGDPVGITGTARFILNLNTNLTNYPANQVVMIDNMPPQLQVTSVTSGTWSEDFDYVRAYVEYSTNNGSTWTAFPSQPISYNTDATYSTGLPDNITNVRWRFEYDTDGELPINPATTVAGLPYVWQFANQPEIRSTPRAVATVADPPSGAAMPVAVLGQTYTNCVYLTREDNSGAVTDPCADEEITVQGDFASLRVSKDETPGTSWDEYEDPNINAFSSDATILPGDTLRYVLRVELTERSSAPLVDPTILDTLPNNLIFVRAGDVRVNGTLLSTTYPAAVVNFTNSQPNGNPGADQTLQWQITNLSIPELELGSQVLTVEFFARIPRGQLSGTRTNELFVDTDSLGVICETGTPRANGCETTDTYVVDRSAALRGEKWIRSVAVEPTYNSVVVNSVTFLPDASCPDGGTDGMTASTNAFTRFPCISQAYPEGALGPTEYVGPASNPLLDDFEYQLRIFNDGNVPMLDYVLYDILPYFGDNGSGGTLASSARNSEFRPVMTGPIEFLGGAGLLDTDFTIEYNLTTNPCRPEVFNQDTGEEVPAACNNDWYSTVVDWSTVRSYRIRLNDGETIAPYVEGDLTNMVRFGLPMSIPADSPTVGVFNNDDAQSGEIAWNSYSHVGSYQDVNSNIRDLLASEPRKVGITIPERFSIGNRVWRDADNSGTINPPDDTNPGIENVLVHLYLASDTSTPIATVETDANGYYLFSNLPAGDYVVGIPAVNFDLGEPLHTLRSSTGTPSNTDYTNPPDGNADSNDHGIDPATLGDEVFSAVITLALNTEPTNDTDLSANLRDGPVDASRGLNGERNQNSDLTVDFGFFGGTDVPFSIGNHLWYDNGAGGGTINNGVRDGTEPPVVGARVELYRDGNGNGNPDPQEYMRFDITDANGFYLFDNLDPGTYYVWVTPGNFQDTFDPDGPGGPLPSVAGPLAGWYSSQPSFDDAVDQNDNGINTNFPEDDGVWSYSTTLARGVDTPLNESHLSAQLDPGSPANQAYNPTGWDGLGSRGRFGEPDNQSNLTIDFGFIPPMSLGNRVWIDDGAGETVFREGYNNGVHDGSEAGVGGVRVELWKGGSFLRFTTTDADGYYLFDRLQPGDDYQVRIPASNFTGAGPLVNYISSFDRAAPSDDDLDMRDKGIDAADPASTGVSSPIFEMSYGAEPTNDDDIPADTPDNVTDYGTDRIGHYGQLDANSNLTLDFGFVLPPRSIGNHLWYDEGGGSNTNNRIRNTGELPVIGARVSLYRDDDDNDIPDGAAIAFDITDSNGFYLFDNLPPGLYLVGVDNTNFQTGGPLDGYTSSVGTLTNADQRDNGIDRIMPYDATASPYGILSATVNMTGTSPIDETHLSNQPDPDSDPLTRHDGINPTEWDGSNSRGRFGETDNRSNLRIDFGFFRPMSLGNRVFYDNGAGTNLNNGIMDGDETGVAGVRVELYHDTNNNNIYNPGTDTLVNWDTTDSNGFYLFDSLAPGNYFVHIPASNFVLTGTGPLRGWHNSTPTGTEALGVNGGTATADLDRDDNGVNNAHPAVNGITSGLVVLAWDTEPSGETELSGVTTNPGAPTNDDFNPTSWDGPESRGRWRETDANSNLTIDFGFIPPLSLGNRVWIDDGLAGGTNILSQFNNRIMDGDEVGRSGVVLELYYDADNDGNYTSVVNGVDEAVPYRTTITDANGHYLFDGLPEGRFHVRVVPSNFNAGTGALDGYRSSTGVEDNENVDLNDNGIDDASYLINGIRSRDFELNYGAEPQTELDVSSNFGVFGPAGIGRFGETDSNSNLTLDFGFMRPHSIGNRVWRDADNSGTINPPDDANPGIASVLVHLYRPTDLVNPITTTTTDNFGYYLFDNLPAGQYVVGIPSSNFAGGAPLENLRSSTGTPASVTYTNPPITNPDSADHGIDSAAVPPAPSTEVYSATLTLGNNEPLNESDLPANTPENQTLYGTDLRGRNGERDQNSNLTVDFGFFGGTDVPFSIGNHLWYDNGAGGGILNDGLRHSDEPPVVGARVELYRDGNGNGPEPQEYMRFDVTDANGFYLFDNLDPGTYYVWVTPGNFQNTFDPDGAGPLPSAAGPLAGWYSSQVTFSNDDDQNDNGIDSNLPETEGVWSNGFTLTRGVDAPLTENHFSGDTSIAAGFSPTAGDGPASIGRFGETNATSNLTIDFGFIPPLSLGNRVWIDDGAGEAFRTQYNDGIQNGSEVGVEDVRVELWKGGNFIRFTTTDADGYYLFDRLQPGDDYQVRIPASNFASGAPLENYISSFDRAAPSDDDQDMRDKGIDAADPASTGISSPIFEMSYGAEPTNDDDISSDTGTYGPDGIGHYGQVDSNSNLTLDFGFVLPPRSIGNYLWFDTGANTNNGVFESSDELPVPNARVSLYRDDDNDGVPDGAAIAWDETDTNGYYLFDNLPPGRYLVGVDADNFTTAGTYSALVGYTSSTSHVDNAANNIDSLDNGRDVPNPTLGYGVLSTTIDLTAIPLSGLPTGESGSGDTSMDAGFNPTAGDGSNSRGRFGETDANSDLTIDFGFVYSYALGNRVWYDTNNNSEMDAGEQPVENVIVELYQADVNGDPIGVTPIASTATNAGGFYLFDYLDPGDYVVVLPASNFTGTGELVGYWSSGTNRTAGGIVEDESRDPNAIPTYNDDRRDNGMRVTTIGDPFENAVISKMVTLGTGAASEPTGEVADQLDPIAGQGNHPDERANMTVDFGFYRVAVGDLVFSDLDKDGAFNNADTPILGVTVRLYASDGTTEIPVGPDGILGTADDASGGMTTDINGQYLFSGLPAGDYIISVQSPLGGSSTFDNNPQTDNDNPNWNVNNNDNGVGVGAGEVFSEIVTITPGGGTRPDTSSKPEIVVTNSDGTTTDRTVDFGFVITTYSLGNRVWFDTNNDNEINFTDGEVGVNGVLVQLYAASDLSTVLATDITSNGGYYLFDNLAAGDYVVVVPASNFAANAALEGYWSSGTEMLPDGTITEGAAPDPNGSPDIDSDDNGTLDTSGGAFNGAVVSLPVTLGPDNSEPTGEGDLESGVGQGSTPDERANMTVDFGFYRVSLGNLIFVDVNRNGTYDAGDLPLQGARVQLFTADGLTEINVGPDGILGTADDAPGGVLSGANGFYLFTGLLESSYLVVVTPPVGYSSTVDIADTDDTTDPNSNTDHNDNGFGEAIGQVSSNIIVLTAGSTGAQSNNTINNANGTTHNPTVDFGFLSNTGLLKQMLGTSEAHTENNRVTIGEVITYQVRLELPLGIPLYEVTVTDNMDKGLAFVDCDSVIVMGTDVTDTACPPVVAAITDSGDSPTDPANPGRQVVFTIGDIPAQTTVTSIVIQYRAVVLDVIGNQNGVQISNNVTWAWSEGSFTTRASNLTIVEPLLNIKKDANPITNVPLGTPVKFIITINHAKPQSRADAFDVIVTDILPKNLHYVQCSVRYGGWAPNTPESDYCNLGTTTTDLVFFWEVFPLDETATITFDAVLRGSPATNTASLEWTSLDIDLDPDGLPVRLSTHNETAHERWYDPPNGVDVYSVTDSVTINPPEEPAEEAAQRMPRELPSTGFAPNQTTLLPEQPHERSYSATEVWVEIPRLGVNMPIVGVPLVDNQWDVSWLWKDAGWLNGTAFPGWKGNSALTGHVVLPDGTPGPFARLSDLRWGDKVIVYAYGSIYTYEVRENKSVSPYNTAILTHEKDAWLTLITCASYNEATNTYTNRIAVRAALLSVTHITEGNLNIR